MIITTVEVRGFRSLADDRFTLGRGLTLVHGPNGAGKTNLLEALFFALTGTSCRTNRARELIRFGEPLARVEVELEGEAGTRTLAAAIGRDRERVHTIDGHELDPDDTRERPAVAVFLPDRLGLVKGPPQVRRAHLDRLTAALSASDAEVRRAYGRALAQRNALLARIRAGTAGATALDAWDTELAARGAELTAIRAQLSERLGPPFTRLARELGLDGEAELSYRPRAGTDAAELVRELGERRRSDIDRGHSTYGPHLDDIVLSRDGRSLRSYGSQGQQRLALLALLMAERELLERDRSSAPLVLLDDVMSELDPQRRALLTELLSGGGQSLITATEPAHVPAAEMASLSLQGGVVAVEAA